MAKFVELPVGQPAFTPIMFELLLSRLETVAYR